MAPIQTDKPNIEHHELYHGEVQLDFNPNSPKYRYVVTDRRAGFSGESVRGVTSVLRDIVAKPDLMTWPMNMANQFYFGSKFDEVTKEYTHDWEKSALVPDKSYSEEELHNMMMDGSRQWTKRADSGKDVGTLVHALVEQYLASGMEGVSPDKIELDSEFTDEEIAMAEKSLQAFVNWWDSLPSKRVISLEQVIYSRSMKYCGTYDLLAEINGRVYMLDLKTTNASKKAPMGIYAEYFLQLGAYSYASREETGVPVDDVGIIRVGKDGQLHVATAEDFGSSRDECERAFAFAIRLHDFLEKVTPFVTDAHFNSHLLPSNVEVEDTDSIS